MSPAFCPACISTCFSSLSSKSPSWPTLQQSHQLEPSAEAQCQPIALSVRAGSTLGVMVSPLRPQCASGGSISCCFPHPEQYSSTLYRTGSHLSPISVNVSFTTCHGLRECANPKHVVYLQNFCRRVNRDNNGSQATSLLGEVKEHFSIQIH